MAESNSSTHHSSGLRIKRILPANTSVQVLQPDDHSQTCITTDDLNNENVTVEDESGKVYRVIQLPRSTAPSSIATGVQLTSNEVPSSCAMSSDVQPSITNLDISHSAVSKPFEYQVQPGSYQLQAVDNETGQKYYIMLPSADTWESVTTTSADPTAKNTTLFPATSSGDSDGGRGASPPSTSAVCPSASAAKRLKTSFGHLIVNSPSVDGEVYTNRKSGADAAVFNLESLVGMSSVSNGSNSGLVQVATQAGKIVTAPREIIRRINHNEVEKKRRDSINMYIRRLARLVPMSDEESIRGPHSKGAVLNKTVDYIYELKDVNAHLLKTAAANAQPPNRTQDMLREEQINRLREQVDQLTRENKALRLKIAEQHLPVSSRGRRGASTASTSRRGDQHQTLTRAVAGNIERTCSPPRSQISSITPPPNKDRETSSRGKSSTLGKCSTKVNYNDANISDEVPDGVEQDSEDPTDDS